jgi:hypothetical protein
MKGGTMKFSLAALVGLLAAAAVLTAGASANGSPYSPGLVEGWDGVLASSGDVRYVTLATPTSTIVAVVRVRGGRVERTRILGGFYGIPIVAYDGTTGGLSGDGRTLVVSSYGPMPGTIGTTRFVLLDTKTFRKRLTIDLRGTWSYDALAPDGSTLYLVQHISAGPRPRYKVRAFDVASARLFPRPIVDTRENEALMRGEPATRASGTTGRWAYTLYGRRKDQPFVHALDTVGRKAFCIDLPLDLGQPKQMRLRLRLDTSGRALRVRDGARTVAVVDTKTLSARLG